MEIRAVLGGKREEAREGEIRMEGSVAKYPLRGYKKHLSNRSSKNYDNYDD